MIKFAVLNDLHLADQSPLGRQPGYQDQLFAKLLGVATYMEANKIGNLILSGDVFHLKRPDRVSHSLVTRLIATFKDDFDCSIAVAPGNHDMNMSGIEGIYSQPLGVLIQSEVVALLSKNDGWVHHGGHSHHGGVLLIGREYATDGDLDPWHYLPTKEETARVRQLEPDVVIMVAHGSLVPPGEKPIYDHVDVGAIPWDEGDFIPDLLLCGHLHEDYGIHKVKGGPIYANLGSFSRPSRQQFVDSRDFLVVTVTDDKKLVLERVPIPNMLLATEVFIEKVEEQEDEALAEFAEQLASSIVLEEQPIEEALRSLGDLPKAVRQRLQEYLEGAGL